MLCVALLFGVGDSPRILAKTPPANEKAIKELIPPAKVFVGGAVKKSGSVVVAGNATLANVMAQAVWTPEADLRNVRIIRRKIVNGNSETVTWIVNFEAYPLSKKRDEANNPVIKNNDRIFVGYRAQVNPKDLLK